MKVEIQDYEIMLTSNKYARAHFVMAMLRDAGIEADLDWQVRGHHAALHGINILSEHNVWRDDHKMVTAVEVKGVHHGR